MLCVYKENALAIWKCFSFSKKNAQSAKLALRQSVSKPRANQTSRRKQNKFTCGQQEPPAPKSLAKLVCQGGFRIKKSKFNIQRCFEIAWSRVSSTRHNDCEIQRLPLRSRKQWKANYFQIKLDEKYDSRKLTFSEILMRWDALRSPPTISLLNLHCNQQRKRWRKWILIAGCLTIHRQKRKRKSLQFHKILWRTSKTSSCWKPIEDPNPEYTKAIQNKYTKQFLVELFLQWVGRFKIRIILLERQKMQ